MHDARQEFVDHYRVLGVSPDASHVEIREAYRREAKRWHPDRNASTEGAERIRLVNDAWETLRHSERKANYDRLYESIKDYRRSRRSGGRERRAAGQAKSQSSARDARNSRVRSAPKAAHESRNRKPWLRIVAIGCALAILIAIPFAQIVSYQRDRHENSGQRIITQSYEGPTGLHRLIERGDVEAWEVQALLDAGTLVEARDWRGETALTAAARDGAAAEVLRLLIGPTVLERSPHALYLLLGTGSASLAQITVLVNAGAVYFDIRGALRHAVHHDYPTEVLELLIGAGGIKGGGTALHILLGKERVDPAQVQLLVEAGASLHETDWSNRTPLEVALHNRLPKRIVDLVTPKP